MVIWHQSWQILRRYAFNVLHHQIAFAIRALAIPAILVSLGYIVVAEFKEKLASSQIALEFTLAHIVISLLHLALGWPSFHFTRWLVNDKATGMKQLMISMGLRKTAYYLGTLLIILVQILVSSLLMKIITNLIILNAADSRLKEYIMLLVAFSCQLTALIFAISALLISRPLTLLILILIGLDNIYTTFRMINYPKILNEPIPVYDRLLALVTPFQSLRIHFRYVARQDLKKLWPLLPITSEDTFWDKPSGIVLTMFGSSIVLFLFAIWFDEVCPWNKHSAPKDPLFCIPGKKPSSPVDTYVSERRQSKYFEARSSDREVGIRISNLSKQFGRHTAVKNLSFVVHSGETTLLLGHNGAGKTTLMDLILGKLNPNCGSVDILQGIGSSAAGIGVCPQDSILDLFMTVEQHLSIFAGIKSPDLSSYDHWANIEQVLHDVQLESHKSKRPSDLSGGMKRKLSLGLAFAGDSRVLILDEPSSGLDPDSRMLIWNTIRRYRNERTVLLSTQHMDEADYLGDRVAIMSAGRIVCCGSSVFLMGLFGNGYNLRVDCEPSFTKQIMQIVDRHFSEAKLSQEDTDRAKLENPSVGDKKVSLTVNLLATGETQDQYESRLIGLLKDMEALDKSKVKSYALRSSNMEDVLLNTNRDLEDDQPEDSNSISLDTGKSNSLVIQSLLASSNYQDLSPIKGQVLVYKALLIKLAYSFRHDYKSAILFRLVLPTLYILFLLWVWSKDRMMPFLIGVVSVHFIQYPANERSSKFKSMQLMSKTSRLTYWLSFFTCDMVSIMVLIIIANICIPTVKFSYIKPTLQTHLVMSAGLTLLLRQH